MFNNTTMLVMTAVSVVGAPLTSDVLADEFAGDWGLNNWSQSGIADGVTSIEALPEQLLLTYDNGPGPVDPWSGTYSVTAAADGHVGFDWNWTGFHAWHMSYGGLQMFIDGPGGTEVIDLISYYDTPSSFDHAGSASIAVHEGYDFGLIVSGENYDSSGSFYGSIKIDNFCMLSDSNQFGLGEDYIASMWSTATGSSATLGVEALLETADTARLCYDVDLGGGGVPYREASYTAPTPDDGTVEFDWSWNGSHSFFESYGALRIEVNGPNGVEVVDLVEYQDVSAPFSFAGSIEFTVHTGYSYSIIVSGENFDSNSILKGCVELSDFDFDVPVVDPCPADLTGDGMVNIDDIFAILGLWGACD